jgi:cytochrome c553
MAEIRLNTILAIIFPDVAGVLLNVSSRSPASIDAYVTDTSETKTEKTAISASILLPWAADLQMFSSARSPHLQPCRLRRLRTRTRAVFGELLKCATCHRIRGEGATVGPDLSNLVSRDAASVLRDLARSQRIDQPGLRGLQCHPERRP